MGLGSFAAEGVDDRHQAASFDDDASAHRSTSLLGVTVHLRAFVVTVGLFAALAACHGEAKRHIVRVEVFEDHVSVDGVVSNLPIQQAVDAQVQGQDLFVLLTAQQSLSAARTDELQRSADKLYLSRGIGMRRVQLECSASSAPACP